MNATQRTVAFLEWSRLQQIKDVALGYIEAKSEEQQQAANEWRERVGEEYIEDRKSHQRIYSRNQNIKPELIKKVANYKRRVASREKRMSSKSKQ